MKLVKMSLLAATLIASSAFAIDNVKVSGDAKLFYHTDDAEADSLGGAATGSLFSVGNSSGQAALGLGVTADLTEGVSAGAHLTALSTLGLQNRLVSNVWEGTNGVDDSFWFDEAWIAGTVGKTTGKIGRMELDTPLVFTETWSIAKNTFEAAVLINQDIPDTTLVGGYIGGDNSTEITDPTRAVVGPMNANGTTNFNQFYLGAYTVGAINNSWKPLTVQAWYYDAVHVASATWLQADFAFDFGLKVGAQYSGLDIKGTEQTAGVGLVKSSNDVFAVMAGYDVKDIVTVSAAFSQTGNDTDNGIGAGGNLSGYGQSKLYTEAWWNYGYITRNDTTAINVTATTPEELTWAELGLYFTQATSTIPAADDVVMSEVTLSASKSFGPLDTSLLYINTAADDLNIIGTDTKGTAFNAVQAYLTYNF